MQRPEDFALSPVAHHFCDKHAITEQEAKEARANAVLKGAEAQADYGDEGSWSRWLGKIPNTDRWIKILCGPDDHTIVQVWPVDAP